MELLRFDDAIDLLLKHHERRLEVGAHEAVALGLGADFQCTNMLPNTHCSISINAQNPPTCVPQSEIDYRPIFVPHIDRYASGFTR